MNIQKNITKDNWINITEDDWETIETAPKNGVFFLGDFFKNPEITTYVNGEFIKVEWGPNILKCKLHGPIILRFWRPLTFNGYTLIHLPRHD